MYEENMDLWLKNKIPKDILSNRNFEKIIQVLYLNGVMEHNEIIKKIQACNDFDIVTNVSLMEDLQLISLTKLGKSNLYSLTDAGVRFARYLKTSN